MAQAKQRKLMAQINVVPYIDVMLVLLIIFMITAPLLTQGIAINLPREQGDPLDDSLLRQNEPLIISIDADGRLYINVGDEPDSPVDAQSLGLRIAAVLRRNADRPVFMKVDQGASYGNFVKGQSLAKQAGARTIVQLVDPPESNLN